jgi:hypothetical protein
MISLCPHRKSLLRRALKPCLETKRYFHFPLRHSNPCGRVVGYPLTGITVLACAEIAPAKRKLPIENNHLIVGSG